MRAPFLVVHTSHLDHYQGRDAGFYAGNFKEPKESGLGLEFFNFKPYEGKVYGFFQLPGNVAIERLGATSKTEGSISGALVLWTAPSPDGAGRVVVGAYRNATVYRTSQQPSAAHAKHRTVGGYKCSYQITAAVEDAVLVPTGLRRKLPTFAPTTKGRPGRVTIYYPQPGTDLNRLLRARAADVFAGAAAGSGAKSSPKKGGRRAVDPENRSEVENAAIDHAWDHFECLGYHLESFEKDRMGFDLEAKKAGETIWIEVKGRSGSDVSAEFTHGEYKNIRKAEAGSLVEAAFRIYILTHALTAKPKAHLFQPFIRARKPTEWRSGSSELILRFKPVTSAFGRAS